MKKQKIELWCNYGCAVLFLVNYVILHKTILFVAFVVFLLLGVYNTVRYLRKR